MAKKKRFKKAPRKSGRGRAASRSSKRPVRKSRKSKRSQSRDVRIVLDMPAMTGGGVGAKRKVF